MKKITFAESLGAPFARAFDAYQRAIIAKVKSGTPLHSAERNHVAITLEELWLPKAETDWRQRRLKDIEDHLGGRAVLYDGQPPTEEDVAKGYGFPTVEAMRQFVKHERKKRKLRHQPMVRK